MDRCPNCDAPVRPNAKFCTSCGFRLPNAEPVKPAEAAPQAAAQPDGWRSPFATTSNYEHNQSWTAPVPSPYAPPPLPRPVPAPAAPVEPIAPAPLEAAAMAEEAAPVFAGWPNFSTSTIPAGEPESETPVEAAVVEEPTAVKAMIDESIVNEPAAAEAPEEQIQIEAVSDAIAETPVEQPVAIESSSDETPGASRPLPEVGENPSDNPTEPIPVMAAIAKSDIVQRALGLVDELRNLIPSLKSSTGAPNSGDAPAILKAAGAGTADSNDLAQLRTSLKTAAERPRDIDVMMDLVSRAGAIQELLAERDKYAAAITQAQAALDAAPE